MLPCLSIQLELEQRSVVEEPAVVWVDMGYLSSVHVVFFCCPLRARPFILCHPRRKVA